MNKENLPVVAHLIYCFDVGGLERVLVNMINAMPKDSFKHVIFSLTYASDFAKNLTENVEVIELHKKAGNDFSVHAKMYQALKALKPAILHTYNISTIEYHPIAWAAGVKGHIHAEHGRDINDPQGLNKKHNFLRKLMSYFIQFFTPVSKDLESWLADYVGINKGKIELIYNGMDYSRFKNSITRPHNSNEIVFGTVARLTPIKDQQNLITAFALLIKEYETDTSLQLRLKIVGDGPSIEDLKQLASKLNVTSLIEFTGKSNQIAEMLETFDVFVLSSLAEGIPMTILEAMASGLPIISTNVGGIPELVMNNKQGLLVDKSNPEQLMNAMKCYVDNTELICQHGRSGKEKIIDEFSEQSMVASYLSLYEKLV